MPYLWHILPVCHTSGILCHTLAYYAILVAYYAILCYIMPYLCTAKPTARRSQELNFHVTSAAAGGTMPMSARPKGEGNGKGKDGGKGWAKGGGKDWDKGSGGTDFGKGGNGWGNKGWGKKDALANYCVSVLIVCSELPRRRREAIYYK